MLTEHVLSQSQSYVSERILSRGNVEPITTNILVGKNFLHLKVVLNSNDSWHWGKVRIGSPVWETGVLIDFFHPMHQILFEVYPLAIKCTEVQAERPSKAPRLR